MARRDITMREVTEIIYQWHQGASISGLARSLGMDRKTIRKYVRQAQAAGISREASWPPEQELVAFLATQRQLVAYATPGQERLKPYHEQLEAWSQDKRITIAQMVRLLREQRPELGASYGCVRAYVLEHFRLQTPAATVRMASGYSVVSCVCQNAAASS